MGGSKTQTTTATKSQSHSHSHHSNSNSHSELSTLINKTLNTEQIDYLTGSNTEISQRSGP